ncbi:MAG: DNA-3-methyladenine glycosylase 2 family protein [Phycisphaerales bacterium]|nr:DNA-3-methyladenine glycosylase 2 family protein [Phycisphaerales bacterium]
MWFDTPATSPDWHAAIQHLRRVEPALRPIITKVGQCTLYPRRDYFILLSQSIFNQQISLKVAAVLFARFRSLFPNHRPTPTRVLQFLETADEQTLRHIGLSRQKRAYIGNLARHFVDGRVPLRRFSGMSDEQIVECLTEIKGIGRWTVEMFLIFVLNRPDVLPVDDLGLRDGVRRVFTLDERPTPKQVIVRGEIWRPWRTIATWYLWRSLDVVKTD